MIPTADTTMDEPRPTTTEFHCRLRTALYNLGEEYGVTGFEAAGVLSYLAAEVNADNLAAEGLLARGPGLKRRWRNEPEPATPTPEDTRQWLDQNPLPVVDERSAGEVMGYGEDGLCGEGAGTMGSRPTSAAAYIAELEEQCRIKDRDIQDLQHLHAQNTEGWQEENAKLTAKVAELEATVAELQSDYRTLDCGHERMTKKATELSERVTALAEENGRLTAELEKAEAKCRDLEQERGARIDETDELYSKLEKAGERVAELEANLAKSQAMHTRLSHDYVLMGKELSGKVEELEATVKKLRVDNGTLNYSYEQMAKKANDLGTRTAVLAGLAKKAEELEEQVKDLQVMRDSLINSGISKTELCKKQAKRIAELEAVYHTLDRDFVLMGQKRIELGEKVKELEAKHESMINALKSMINALRGGIELRERLTERIAYLTAELQAARKPRIWGIF